MSCISGNNVDDPDEPTLNRSWTDVVNVVDIKEGVVAVLLRYAKNKYVEKGLVGKITIQVLCGLITSGEFCVVEKSDTFETIGPEDLQQLGSLNFKATSAMDMMLANLSRRSKQYDSDSLRADVTLTQGVVVGLGIPFFISMCFQAAIQFEVSVHSLVGYRKRKAKLLSVQKKLKAIPNSVDLIDDLVRGGFSRETAQQAVVATNGVGEEEALKWAAQNDTLYAISDSVI